LAALQDRVDDLSKRQTPRPAPELPKQSSPIAPADRCRNSFRWDERLQHFFGGCVLTRSHDNHAWNLKRRPKRIHRNT
jgi:hypothetical protein